LNRSAAVLSRSISGRKTTDRNALNQQTSLLPADEKCQLIKQKLSVGTFHLLASWPEFNNTNTSTAPEENLNAKAKTAKTQHGEAATKDRVKTRD